MSNNALSGTLPSTFGNFHSVRCVPLLTHSTAVPAKPLSFHPTGMPVAGSVPCSDFLLGNNQLTGTLPAELSGLTSVV